MGTHHGIRNYRCGMLHQGIRGTEKGKVRIMENELHTWIVIDQDGDRHEVTAHYIAQPTYGGYTNFVIDGEANMGIMHSFYNPRSIILKEPLKLSGPPENYP